jgi:hypothetical protein
VSNHDESRTEEVWLADEQLVHLADLIAERLAKAAGAQQSLVDAATLAQQLGVSRATIYEHARELGAVRIGAGGRGRLRFDPVQVRQVLAEKDAEGVPAGADRPSAVPRTRRTPSRGRQRPSGPIWYRRYGLWLDPKTGEPMELQPRNRDGSVMGPQGEHGASPEELQLHMKVSRGRKRGVSRGDRWDPKTLMYVHSVSGLPLSGPGEERDT